MILHSPIISGSLTFADGSTFTLPDNGIYSGSYSGSFQGTTYTGGTFIGNGSQLTFGGTGIVSGSSQLTNDLDSRYLNTNGEGVVSGSSQVTISGTTGYSTFSSSLDSRISTEKDRVDAILAASTADSDTFAEIVSLINSVDTSNDSAFASFYTASNATNDAQSARLSSIESVTGSYETKGRGIVSGSSQVVYTSLSSIPAGIVSGSSQINLADVSGNTTSNVNEGTNLYYTDARVKTKLNAEGVISGSIQVLGGTGIVSGSSQVNLADASGNTTSNISEGSNLYYTDARVKTKLTAEGVISGSSQVTYASISSIPAGIVSGSAQVTPLLPAGSVSGSSQVTISSTTGYTDFSSSVDSRIITEKQRVDAILASADANADTFAEIVTLINSVDTDNDSAFASFYTSSNATDAAQNARLTSIESVTGSYETKGRGIVSGSSQITYASISSIPAGIVSGSAQVTPLLPSGVVSGSSQVTYASISSIPSGIVSGSTQVTSLLPVGVVSGSSQINLASVNGNSTSNVTEGSNLYYTDARVKTKLNADAVVSGSSQISHDSTTGFVANKHIDHTAVSITAGNGLTGGGDISSTRTLNVVGGNGISVNADNIELAGTYTGTWAVTGGITATADVVAYASSDRRLKDNIKNIENPIEKVQQLNGVTWEWNSNADELQQSLPTVGVIAQEVEEVLPQLVHDRENGYKGVDYAKLTGLLIEAIKEQQKQIDELKSKLQ